MGGCGKSAPVREPRERRQARGLERRPPRLETELGEPPTLPLGHLDPPAVEVDRLSDLREPSEEVKHVAADRLDRDLRRVELERRGDIAEREPGLDHRPAAVGRGRGELPDVELVADRPDELLEHGLERDETRDSAELIDHDREPRAGALEGVKGAVERGDLRNEDDRAGDPLDRAVTLAARDGFREVPHVDHADHVLEVGRRERVARVLPLEHDREVLLERVLREEGDHVAPRDHVPRTGRAERLIAFSRSFRSRSLRRPASALVATIIPSSFGE